MLRLFRKGCLIDYSALAKYLAEIGVKPHLVLEEGPEAGTAKTMDAVEAHRRSRSYVDQIFLRNRTM